jgi:AraC family transcriptional regulator
MTSKTNSNLCRFSVDCTSGRGTFCHALHAIADSGICDRPWQDEQFPLLVGDLLELNGETRKRAALMPANRPATRAELFRRVRRGQEYLHASASSDSDLAEIARQACLSPYHFHRAFGQTPHQCRNRLRLGRARRMLKRAV